MARFNIFLLLIVGLLSRCWSGANGQFPSMYALTKPGSCPPTRDTTVCTIQCSSDSNCPAQYKCCPTKCGTACSYPAVEARPRMEKAGRCPAAAEGPWVCTSRCQQDSDCRRDFKCCRNRCGALACQRPQLD